MSFKEEYLKYSQPSVERENFLYNYIVNNISKEQIVSNMKPITVTKSDGTKLTYKVMPDYLSVQGIRVPLSGQNSQRIADHFGLSLPTTQQAKEIYNHADVKVSAKPLSGSGTTVGNKQYSGQDVVDKGVGYAPFAINYNEKINQQLAEHGDTENKIVSGFAKDIVAPPAPGKLGLYGLFDANGKPIQGGNGETPHDTAIHSEYGTFVRLISPDVTITYPDGRKETKPMDEVYNTTRYNSTPTKPIINKPIKTLEPVTITPSTDEKPLSGRMQLLQRIDKFLDSIK
jgi:hypothetical protein